MLYFRIQFEFIFQRSSLPWGKPQSDITVSGCIPASDLSHVRFISHIPAAFKSGPNRATSVPIPSWGLLFHCSPKKTGKDVSFSMTGDSRTWLCLCSLESLYCVHLERTAEIPKKRFLFSFSSHLYSATTYLPKHQAPQQILQHNFPGYHEPLLELFPSGNLLPPSTCRTCLVSVRVQSLNTRLRSNSVIACGSLCSYPIIVLEDYEHLLSMG